ncbi:hypothetical protein K438DRAFT_1658392 [Mycena galopus ATCC 62051]|nr:hypothetical protein K438DRAFT_1658392 [Mycena galopus ATCC 62051]
MASIPQKRQRTEDEPITRSEEWNRDGSLVLQAANTQFRVHWSILARHSSVFCDMQGLPQPPGQDTVEGCPVVELSDDPEDVQYLLKALYSPSFHCQQKLGLPVIGAFLQLGRKYDFKELFDSAVARLTSDFPTTLQGYMTASHKGSSKAIHFYPGWIFDIITLARENNILSVLPSAYYWAVNSRNIDKLFHGVTRNDGTHASLPLADLRICLVGQQRLLKKQFQPGYTLGWARDWEFLDCANLAQCRASRQSIVTSYLDSDNAYVKALAKPRGLGDLAFCATCAPHIKKCMAAGRQKIWEELPAIFDLPPWNELLKNDI